MAIPFLDISMTMFYSYHIPIKLISKQVDLSYPHLSAKDYSISMQGIYSFLQSARANSPITLIGHTPDQSLLYLGCRHSITQLFNTDSFLDWEGHHSVCTPTHTRHNQSLSPDHSTVLIILMINSMTFLVIF